MHKPLKTFPLFKSIDQALAKLYEVRAMSGVKIASYGIQTAASSVTDKLMPGDRVIEAAWIFDVVQSALSEVERAVVTCAYDGLGAGRHEAIETLASAFSGIARNPDLVRELLTREFDFGETYAKSLPQIARDTDSSLRTVERASRHARKQIADARRGIDRALRETFEPRGWIRAA